MTTTRHSIARARFSHVRIAPRKMEGLANLVRGRRIEEAMACLRLCPRKGAKSILKLLKSAVANADQRGGTDVDRLVVRAIRVNGGPQSKRWRPRSRGMAHPLLKRTTHVEVELGEK